MIIAVRRELPSGGMKSILAVRQRKIDYHREAKRKLIIAVRRRKNRYRREAKKKIDIAVRRKKIDIALRGESPSGGMKLIFAVRQRKNQLLP